jgi:hypothetical protein
MVHNRPDCRSGLVDLIREVSFADSSLQYARPVRPGASRAADRRRPVFAMT